MSLDKLNTSLARASPTSNEAAIIRPMRIANIPSEQRPIFPHAVSRLGANIFEDPDLCNLRNLRRLLWHYCAKRKSRVRVSPSPSENLVACLAIVSRNSGSPACPSSRPGTAIAR